METYNNCHRPKRSEYAGSHGFGRYDGLNKVSGYVESKVSGGLESPGQGAFFRKPSISCLGCI